VEEQVAQVEVTLALLVQIQYLVQSHLQVVDMVADITCIETLAQAVQAEVHLVIMAQLAQHLPPGKETLEALGTVTT
jgi:hypothetical protein